MLVPMLVDFFEEGPGGFQEDEKEAIDALGEFVDRYTKLSQLQDEGQDELTTRNREPETIKLAEAVAKVFTSYCE
jgi:hypothetical protein